MLHLVYVELDALLDTRLATIAKLNRDPLDCLSKGAIDRVSDEFDIYSEGLTDAAFKAAYAKRDLKTLSLAGPTEMLFLLQDIIAMERMKGLTGDPTAGNTELTLNVYPYKLDAEHMTIYAEAVAEALNIGIESVDVCYLPYVEMNDAWLRGSKYALIVIYNYEQWLVETFGKYASDADPIGSSTTIVMAPKLMRCRADLQKLMKLHAPDLPTKDPFILEGRLRAKMFSLDFRPIQTFTLVKFNTQVTRMNSIVKACNHVNEVAGKKSGDSINWEAARHQYEYQLSELEELRAAIEAKDVDQYRDAIADVIMTTVGHGSINPIPIEEDFLTMAEALMSRFDTTEEDALLTMEKYHQLGLSREHITYREVMANGKLHFPVLTKRACVDNKGEKYSPNKFLKSYNYYTPVYAPLAK